MKVLILTALIFPPHPTFKSLIAILELASIFYARNIKSSNKFLLHVLIINLLSHTGDDCIAINTDTSFVNITNINCGPGHGIR